MCLYEEEPIMTAIEIYYEIQGHSFRQKEIVVYASWRDFLEATEDYFESTAYPEIDKVSVWLWDEQGLDDLFKRLDERGIMYLQKQLGGINHGNTL